MKSYIEPFDSIDQMFKALIAFKKIKHYKKIDLNIANYSRNDLFNLFK
jgi:hypothetical protein